jgi:hypothetical protein
MVRGLLMIMGFVSPSLGLSWTLITTRVGSLLPAETCAVITSGATAPFLETGLADSEVGVSLVTSTLLALRKASTCSGEQLVSKQPPRCPKTLAKSVAPLTLRISDKKPTRVPPIL